MKKARVIAAMLLAVLLAFPGMMAVQAAEWNSEFKQYKKTNYNIVDGVTESTVYMRKEAQRLQERQKLLTGMITGI